MTALLFALLLVQAPADVERLHTAERLMDNGRCAEAIPLLKTLLAGHPEAPTIRYGLGRCYFETHDYAAAVTTLQELVRTQPESAEIRFFLGSSLGLSGNIPEAFLELRKAMELDPTFEPAYRAFGMFRVQGGMISKDALEALQIAVRLDPRDARAWYWLGEYYRANDDNTQARRQFERADQIDPKDPAIQLGLGRVLLDDGEVDAALSQFDAVLRLQPSLVPALLGRARALYYQGRAAQALAPAEAARKDARHFDDATGAAWILCRIYRVLGREAEAQAAERKLKELQDSFAARLARAEELSDQAIHFEADGRPDKVVETLEAYMQMKDTDPDVLIRLGDAYRKLGRLDDARRCYIRASQFGPLTEGLRRRLQDR